MVRHCTSFRRWEIKDNLTLILRLFHSDTIIIIVSNFERNASSTIIDSTYVLSKSYHRQDYCCSTPNVQHPTYAFLVWWQLVSFVHLVNSVATHIMFELYVSALPHAMKVNTKMTMMLMPYLTINLFVFVIDGNYDFLWIIVTIFKNISKLCFVAVVVSSN